MLGEGAYTYEAIHDWGELPPQLKWGNTHGVVEDAQGHIYVHHTVHATSDSADTVVVFDDSGKFVRSWGKEFRGVAHGLQLRKEGRDEFLYLTRQRREPQDDAAARDAGRRSSRRRSRARSSGRSRGRRTSTPTSRPPTARRRATTRPTSRSRRTATSTSPTATARTSSTSTTSKAEYIRTFGGRGADAGHMTEPHGIWMDTRGATPVLVVADRRNNRLQRFTLDGKHIDFIPGFRLPCHFDERKGLVVIPDLHGRVTLLDGTTRSSRTSATRTRANWNNPLRREPREEFIPGQFICPHGACFDHDGNIFVVEWVEVGRVTKLRKVS